MIHVRINGEETELSREMSLREFLSERGYPQDGIAVALNEAVVPKALHPATLLRDRDVIEVIHAVGGGAPNGKPDEE